MSRPDPQAQPATDEQYDEDLERFLARCRADPGDALDALMERLTWAGEEHMQVPNARKGLMVATSALCGFCNERGEGRAALMFAHLLDALTNLDQGTTVAIVRARRIPKVGNRPRDPGEKYRAIVYGLECVERLRSIEKLSAIKSRSIVAGWLTGRPEFDEPCTAMQLRNWRQKFGRDPRFEGLRSAASAALAPFEKRSGLQRGLARLGKPPS